MTVPRSPRRLLASAYAWLPAVFFGAVLLDVVYSSLPDHLDGFVAGPSVYSEVSDFFLMLGALTILFALAAIVICWDVGSALPSFRPRNLTVQAVTS